VPTRKTSVIAIAAALAAVPILAFAQAVTFKGAITERDGDRIVVRTAEGDKTVVVGPGTKIQKTVGTMGVRRETVQSNELLRGLAIEVTANPSPSGDELTASSILFRQSDARTALQIDAGVQAERDRIAEAERRLDNVGELEAAGRTKVFFETGKSTLSEEGKRDLQAIAAQAKQIKGGYRLAVVGRADPRGNAAANQRLSEKRAAAVTDYLMREAGVRPGSILPQTAIGASPVADDPDQPKTLAEGRRVTVTILVSKANTSVARTGASTPVSD
jgi:outer membrane protein OmpA-like peptidoglycan-associated protein